VSRQAYGLSHLYNAARSGAQMRPVIPTPSCDGEDYVGGEYSEVGYDFFLCFLSLSIGFGIKNHQASIARPIVQPAIMTQLQIPAIEKFSHPVSIS